MHAPSWVLAQRRDGIARDVGRLEQPRHAVEVVLAEQPERSSGGAGELLDRILERMANRGRHIRLQ